MSAKGDGHQNPQNAKVLQLGFNISVSGDPDTDFQIVLDDKGQKAIQLPSDVLQDSSSNAPKQEIERINSQEEVKPANSMGAIPKHSKHSSSSDSSKIGEVEKSDIHKDSSLINEIKNTMEHFDKFSDHLREIPRLKSYPLATSTPFSDKQNSKSESSLICPEYRPRRFAHLYDFHSRKEYFRGSMRPLPPDLFLKPLPGEDYYKRGTHTRYMDLEPYRHYGSADSLNKTSDYKSALCPKSKFDVDKYDLENLPPVGILKKPDSDNGDKQSTSSAESVKDIKIYQSGGILIMQNFKENLNAAEKRDISDFSAKLIENCHKLREEITIGFSEDRPFIGNSSDESKNLGKMVQFDLPEFGSHKSKSSELSYNTNKGECSPVRMESSESMSDCLKNKDTSPQGTSQSQDFPSISTQENDSVVSNQPGMSPTLTSGKKLEWDSGADVGYLNLDLSKENLSTIERIVLKGITSDGLREKKVVYEKKPELTRSKFILERMPSDLVVEENEERTNKMVQDKVEDKSHENKPRKSSKEGLKDESQSAGEETNPFPAKNEDVVKPENRIVTSTDKSVNVNTLFQDTSSQSDFRFIEHPSKARALKSSPKIKKLKKKKVVSQKNLTAPLKDKIESIIDIARYSSRSKENIGMGIPKRVYKKLEANPQLNDMELSREVEEIIIDQRFKIKQNVGREVSRETPTTVTSKTDDVETKKETKTKSRPISASSSSNNTVLPNLAEAKEEVEKKEVIEVNKFTDQIIQTNDCKVESVGIQAFASLKSSEGDVKNGKEPSKTGKIEKEPVNVSSKNIQSFGLNSSLPKEVAHRKETKSGGNQNTKSTQFFGGPINSLPNYHASLVTKPGESCGRMPKVLKAKKNLETEIIRLKEENEKNIMANDVVRMCEPKRDIRRGDSNKENLITEKSSNSKRSQNNSSKGDRNNGGSSELKESDKKETSSPEESECLRTSDEVSSKVLTSEVLKEHGDSIDRNIIQEKYFQSQLIEIEKREMISRSTSMEKQLELEGNLEEKELVTVGCQYSPLSKETSEGESKHDDKPNKGCKKRESQLNFMEEGFGTSKSTNQDFGAGDSLPSSTQTAHSWIPGRRDSDQDTKNGVGRARSFEYLPGHIYESSGNLREELPRETERNLITSSSDCNTEKLSMSEEEKDSEGRNTLVLENSTEPSQDSDRMKVLNENLTQLDFVVSKLREKDTQIQTITQTLLVNLLKNNGSGDCSRTLGGTPKANEMEKKNSSEGSFPPEDCGDGSSGMSSLQSKKKIKEKDISIACQTEEKSSMSETGMLNEERKALARRISEEKENQIKWIENEIHHLNILRGLLEKQNSSSLRKKKQSPLSLTSNGEEKSEEKYSKGLSGEVYPPPVTPVYGCTISLVENKPECQETRQENPGVSEPSVYGMAVSLTGGSTNLQRVVMLPVGVQVTLKDNKPGAGCEEKDSLRRSSCQQSPKTSSPNSISCQSKPCSHHHHHRRISHSDINTQYPSLRNNSRNFISTFAQTSFTCRQCQQDNCVCLNLSEKSYEMTSGSSKSRGSVKRDGLKLSFVNNGEPIMEDNTKTTSDSTNAGVLDLESDTISKTCERALAKSGRESLSNYLKCKPTQDPTCKCPKRSPSNAIKSGTVSRGPCQSNIYLNCEKESFGTCRCSKIQVQKSSNCACHIIKIHGSKCCSADNASPSSSGKRPGKKLESQCCQTDEIPVVTKDLMDSPELVSVTKAPGVEYPSEGKIAIEGRRGIVEKFSYDPKVSYEKKHPLAAKMGVKEKYGLQREIPERDSLPKTKTLTPVLRTETGTDARTPVPPCSCRKSRKEKPKPDDHPRHYFLKIEETEMDESNESTERRKSLEVITVTVPVKKAGKAKIYGNKIRQASQNEEPSKDFLANCCKCCDKRIGSRKGQRQHETLDGERYRRTTAEKPESSKRVTYPRGTDSFDDVNNYSGAYNDTNCQSSSSQEFYEDGIERTKSSSQKSRVDSCTCSELANSPSRDFQSEYDSHKECRKKNDREPYHEDGRRQRKTSHSHKRDERFREDWISESANSRNDQYNSDYYNYNKREFMTKSELMKEEEKKRKAHQPSLQEYLTSNRPDFCSSAESRRQIISERAKERTRRHNNRMECLINLIHHCDDQSGNANSGTKRIFTTAQMREQTMKKYRKLPEVTGKIADEKKKQEYRTNKLMGDIYGKKLQIEALKGHINLSNSVSVLSMI